MSNRMPAEFSMDFKTAECRNKETDGTTDCGNAEEETEDSYESLMLSFSYMISEWEAASADSASRIKRARAIEACRMMKVIEDLCSLCEDLATTCVCPYSGPRTGNRTRSVWTQCTTEDQNCKLASLLLVYFETGQSHGNSIVDFDFPACCLCPRDSSMKGHMSYGSHSQSSAKDSVHKLYWLSTQKIQKSEYQNGDFEQDIENFLHLCVANPESEHEDGESELDCDESMESDSHPSFPIPSVYSEVQRMLLPKKVTAPPEIFFTSVFAEHSRISHKYGTCHHSFDTLHRPDGVSLSCFDGIWDGLKDATRDLSVIEDGIRNGDSGKIKMEEQLSHRLLLKVVIHNDEQSNDFLNSEICVLENILCTDDLNAHSTVDSQEIKAPALNSFGTDDHKMASTASVQEGDDILSHNVTRPVMISDPEDIMYIYDVLNGYALTSQFGVNQKAESSVNSNVIYENGPDQLSLSKDSMDFDAECLQSVYRAEAQSNHLQKLCIKHSMQVIRESKIETRHLMGTLDKSDGTLCLPSDPRKTENKDKEREDSKSKNIDDINDYAWTWQIPNISPGSRDIIVAMLKSPGRNSLPSLSIVHSGMENEWKRLMTFAQFIPPVGVFILRLAAAGFLLPARGEGETPDQANVECAFCGVMVAIVDFVQKNAMELHQERSPGCKLVLGQDVGNVSVAQLTERSGQEFLQELSSSFSKSNPGKSPRPASSSPVSASTAPRPSGQPMDLAVDACPDTTTAVDRPPTTTPGHTVPPSGNPLMNTDNGKPLPPAAPGQQARPAIAAASSASASVTAASTTRTDSVSSAPSSGQNLSRRPASAAGISEPAPPSRAAGSSASAPVPLQTARVEQPHVQAGNSTRENTASSPANPPAANAAQVTDGASRGTATQEPPPQSSAEEPSRQGAQTGGNEDEGNGNGEGNRNSGEDRPQERQVVTYEELGIYTQQPKRPDMVVKAVRINTFERWPHVESHPAEEMAEAGFYFTGHEDLVRCFHCKGGLKTWERSDKPWVEHSRWFPRCPFVRLAKGQKFVDAVQKLNNPQTRPAISEEDVEREVRRMEDEERGNLGPDVVLFSSVPPPAPENDPTLGPLARAALRVDADVTEASLAEMTEHLEDENEEMRDSIRCKMCQMNNVNVLFLPCGHLVACTQCAPALRRCAMCRAAVKGFVHVYMDDRRDRGNNARDGSPGAGTQETTA